MSPAIDIVEPTLTTAAGHCHSFIQALLAASPAQQRFVLWANRRAILTIDHPNLTVRRHFYRRLRKLQAPLLYRCLLAGPSKLFIATAGFPDFLALDWIARSPIPRHKVYLYVHWFHTRPAKMHRLQAIAQRQPNLEIIGPTASVIEVFSAAGFPHARIVPYPISPLATAAPAPFHHLLYAGAARRDKGFRQVVDLVEWLARQGATIPVWIQTSAEHFGKYDAETLRDLERLRTLRYPPLRLITETLDDAAYQALFPGAIVLQFYDGQDFADRISGVTLDAFSHGCPILTTPGTWMARQASRFGAGLACADDAAEAWHLVQAMIADYTRLSSRAWEAGRRLQQENRADQLYRVLSE